MNKLLLLISICIFTACTKNKLTIDENFNWNLSPESTVKLFPPKDDMKDFNQMNLFTSEKKIKHLEYKDIVFQYDSEHKMKYITFRGFNNYDGIKKYIDSKTVTHFTCSSLSGESPTSYYYGFIKTEQGDSRFVYSLNSSHYGYLTISRSDSSIFEDEDTSEKRNLSVAQKCKIED